MYGLIKLFFFQVKMQKADNCLHSDSRLGECCHIILKNLFIFCNVFDMTTAEVIINVDE
jgi:hypothetical protein